MGSSPSLCGSPYPELGCTKRAFCGAVNAAFAFCFLYLAPWCHLGPRMPLTPVTPRPSPTPRCHFLCRGCAPGPSPPVVPFLMLCSPLSFSPPVLLPPRRAGKAGWWCYPWFWDSQSKMTLPISPTCNPLGRSRTSRTLRGTRGRRKEEGSPAGGRDAGWRRRRRRRLASRSAQVGATRQRARRRLQLSPLERQRRAHPDPFLPILPSFPPSIPIPITGGRMLGGFRAPCQERMHCWDKGIPKILHHTVVHTQGWLCGSCASTLGLLLGPPQAPRWHQESSCWWQCHLRGEQLCLPARSP